MEEHKLLNISRVERICSGFAQNIIFIFTVELQEYAAKANKIELPLCSPTLDQGFL